jgi:hypothetical protein
MRILIAALLLVTNNGLASGESQSPPVDNLISIYAALNDMCRGWSGDDPHTDQVCSVREKVGAVLKKMGYCSDDASWHKCRVD